MRYPGGKGKTYQHLINLMPPHRVYIESHLGGGAVLRNKIPAEKNIGIDRDPDVIASWDGVFDENFEFVTGDAVSFLSSYEFVGDELLYIDPPYHPELRRSRKVYKYDYTIDNHKELLTILVNLPCMVMLSGYESDLYNKELAGWRKVHFNAKTHTDVREECVWINFEPPKRLHDTRYLGRNFRERQTIKRRQERLYARIEKMDPIERSQLASWISERYGNGGAV
jgi:DNA adenine methylase